MNDLTYEQKLRIEALRAASRIVAGEIVAELHDHDSFNRPDQRVMYYAGHIAHYLETGEK